MKKILIFIGFVMFAGNAKAAEDVHEVAYQAVVTSVSISTSVATAISSSTLVAAPFAFNICNESTTAIVRCGYSNKVSTSGNFLGFPVRPSTCEYRAVGYNAATIFCIAEGASAITIVREIFGRDLN